MNKEDIDLYAENKLFCLTDESIIQYHSPIETVETIERVSNDIREEIDNRKVEAVMKTVLNVGVKVDKEELIKALQYDRNQYEQGFNDCMKQIEEKYGWHTPNECLPEDGEEVIILTNAEEHFIATFEEVMNGMFRSAGEYEDIVIEATNVKKWRRFYKE